MTVAVRPLLLLLAALVMLTSCGEAPARSDRHLQVVCTTGMIADLARAVAGERCEVHALLAPGTDPHLHKPTRDDLKRIAEADLVLYNGWHLEGRMTELFRRAAEEGRAVVAVAEALATAQARAAAGEVVDPHLWMDPVAWQGIVPVILAQLTALDPEGQDIYTAHAAALEPRLAALDAWIRAAVASIPEERRLLVTAHDAFGHFGARYGLEVLAIQGLSTESEAGVADIERLVRRLVATRLPVVFAETTVSDRNLRALLAGAQAQGHEVRLGAALYSDAMGTEGTPEGTYLGMMEHNVRAIVLGLGGALPPLPALDAPKR